VWALHAVFVGTPAGQRLDAAGFVGARLGRRLVLGFADDFLLDTVSVAVVAAACLAVAAIALARRRPRVAIAAVVLIGGANGTTQVLKKLVFDRPDFGVTDAFANSLPSGHTTVAASIVCALILAVGPAARPLVAVIGAAYTAATGVAVVIVAWHRPSDALAGALVAAAWAALVILAGDMARAPGGRRAGEPGPGPAAGGFQTAVRLALIGCGVLGLAAAAWTGVSLWPDVPREGPVTAAEHLRRGVQTRAFAMTGLAVGATACLADGAVLALLPWRERKARRPRGAKA
jgi:membrane-associated phospholipid phosphatase